MIILLVSRELMYLLTFIVFFFFSKTHFKWKRKKKITHQDLFSLLIAFFLQIKQVNN
mgnify:CR=1 FL=1|jgi:hypothetical protein